MKKIYILNYQREIPPFAQLEVKYAKKYFDDVVFITRRLVNDNSASIKDTNVRVIQIGLFTRFCAILRLPLLCFSNIVLREVYKAAKYGLFSLSYLKDLLLELYVAEQLYITCKKDMKTSQAFENYVLSCWFNGIAIAAAKLQKEGRCKSFSYAHAFEIDPSRNKFVGHLLEGYKHKYLTNISFIASVMLKKYIDKVYPVIGVQTNTSVDYLGTEKMFYTQTKSPCEYTICSCSSVNEIKRLNLLVEALSYVKKFPIRWIHIGDGPDLHDIQSMAMSCLGDNVKYYFLGRLSNDKVQEFYSSNAIDLFINVSRLEGLPISIMEAMSYSIPCMATNVGGTSEIVNNLNGVLLKADITPLDLSEEIVRFMLRDDRSKDEIKKTAYHDWDEKFNADKNISNYYIKMISIDYGK